MAKSPPSEDQLRQNYQTGVSAKGAKWLANFVSATGKVDAARSSSAESTFAAKMSASVDGTAGTFVELATNSPVPLQDGSKKFHGVVFSGAPLAQVAAKPASLRIKLTSSSLDIVGEIFTYGAGYGGGIATNDQQPYF